MRGRISEVKCANQRKLRHVENPRRTHADPEQHVGICFWRNTGTGSPGRTNCSANRRTQSLDQGDRKARADLLLAVSASELKHVSGCTTPKEVWDMIESTYAPKGPAQMASLLRRLLQKKMAEGDDVRTHMAQFFETVDKLEAMEVEINSKLLTLMLMQSLPSSYDVDRAIESRDTLPCIDVLKNKILETSEASKEDPELHGAMYVNHRKQKPRYDKSTAPVDNKDKNQGGAKRRPRYNCNYCNKPGHKVANCLKKASDKEKDKANNVEEEAWIVKEVNNQPCDYANMVHVSSVWCLDSGCTSHMCNDESAFINLVEATSGLNLADGTLTQVTAKGDVDITVQVGKKSKVIKLNPNRIKKFIQEVKINNKNQKKRPKKRCIRG